MNGLIYISEMELMSSYGIIEVMEEVLELLHLIFLRKMENILLII